MRQFPVTCREKIKWVAEFFGDEYIEKPKSLIVISWERRFTFNDKGDIIKMQDVMKALDGKVTYITPRS